MAVDRLRTRPAAAAVGAAVACLLVAALAAVTGGPAAAGPRLAGTSCREVGGSAVSSPGPHRATVVVDTGSGAVWSACVSFSGTINGIQAIEAARQQIPDLDPVYDVYAGEGRAVCKLRGVGNEPPDCLGKTAAYWQYFHNGTYSRSCACAMTVADGGVEAWRWASSSGAPRGATAGYEATVAPVTTTTRPVTTTTKPTGPGAGSQGGGLVVSPGGVTTTSPPAGGPHATTTAPHAGSSTTSPSGSSTTTLTPTSSTAPTKGGSSATSTTVDGGRRSTDEQASGPKAIRSITPVSAGRGSSSTGSALGFAVALVVAAAVALAMRMRRRRVASAAGGSLPLG
jgi:hypothetical protein